MIGSPIDPNTPVLVGVGVATRREQDPALALEPIDLMLEAVLAAGEDCGASALLAQLDSIAVPRGRWRYRNPAGEIKRALGADGATTVLSTVGVLQQTLIADACEAIAEGKIESALVAGADAGYRILQAKIAGGFAEERNQDDDPDVLLEPKAELRHPAEQAAGLSMPVGLYAIVESARRATAGLDLAAHRDRMAERYAKFAAIAAENPQAWNQTAPTAADIRDAGPRNPMQAFPYTRLHCSTWNVDQAGALLLCSAQKALELGIDRAQWVFPIASAEANHMVPVSARADLTRSPGAEAVATAVYQISGMTGADIDLIDLYSCFPVAVDVFAEAAGLDDNVDLTVTGGMSFAGGPYNNYFLQATVRAAQLMREGHGRSALLSCVSGVITKQAFAIWSIEAPKEAFASRDVTAQAKAASAEVPVVQDYTGGGRVVGCTVVYDRSGAAQAVALIDTDSGTRALAISARAEIMAAFEQDEWVGRRIDVVNGQISA